jgi:Flp pilus assembly protein TadG
MVRARPAPGSEDRGAVAVEFALLFPLLFFLLFGTLLVGWRLWEAQAGQAVAREAARLAGLGVPSAAGFGTTVARLATDDGLNACRVSGVSIAFLDPTLAGSATPAVGGYVTVTVTYRSMLGSFPGLGTGTMTASAVSRVEQLVAQPGALTGDLSLAVGGEQC